MTESTILNRHLMANSTVTFPPVTRITDVIVQAIMTTKKIVLMRKELIALREAINLGQHQRRKSMSLELDDTFTALRLAWEDCEWIVAYVPTNHHDLRREDRMIRVHQNLSNAFFHRYLIQNYLFGYIGFMWLHNHAGNWADLELGETFGSLTLMEQRELDVYRSLIHAGMNICAEVMVNGPGLIMGQWRSPEQQEDDLGVEETLYARRNIQLLHPLFDLDISEEQKEALSEVLREYGDLLGADLPVRR